MFGVLPQWWWTEKAWGCVERVQSLRVEGLLTKRTPTALAVALVVALVAAATALAAPPGNNDFPGFSLSGDDVSFSGTNVDATSQPDEDNHANAARGETCEESDPSCITSAWWTWTAPRAGTVNVNLCRSGFDTTLAVYTGSNVGSLTEVASNDDLDPTEEEDEPGVDSETRGPLKCPANRTASGVEFAAVAGATYRIAVAGFAGETGAIKGRITYGALGTLPPNSGRCSNRSPGTDGKDRLIGTPFGDKIGGLRGNDRVSGGRGDDCLFGDRGNDRLDGGPGKDKVSGGVGNDRVGGGDGNDVVAGDSGNDRLRGGRGNDRIVGGSGNDRIGARDGKRDRIDCGRGRDRLDADKRDRVRRCESVRRR